MRKKIIKKSPLTKNIAWLGLMIAFLLQKALTTNLILFFQYA